jgi:hypothetical protein
MDDQVKRELARRLDIWAALKARGGPDGIRPELIKELRIHRGQQGVFRDLDVTRLVTGDPAGITVGVLHTGSAYADDLSEQGVIYHYPSTDRGSRDDLEIRASKACGELGVPLFVVITPARGAVVRDVRLSWVSDFDDGSGQMVMVFSEAPQPLRHRDVLPHDDPEFRLQEERRRGESRASTRPTQWRFRFDVLKRYGPRCAVCDIRRPDLLQAAHLCPVEADGSDDPRNGLVFCLNHHRAFDLGLLRIHPETLAVHPGTDAGSLDGLGVLVQSIGHLPHRPHREALCWAWTASGAGGAV